MTDVNFKVPKQWSKAAPVDGEAGEDGMLEYELIELLFFAYRDFTSDPDEILAEYGFGRAHHRVLHFVSRNPGIRVTDLLDILKITKQSLGRVLKQLVDESYIDQKTGPLDRRQRLLYATGKGRDLAERLVAPQSRRIEQALTDMPAESREIARQFLYRIINEDERARVAQLANKR